MKFTALLSGFASVGLLACSPAVLQMPTVQTPSLTEARGTRLVTELTDLETVRDVAADASHVYVATDRGLLVYEAEGHTDATRITEGLASEDVRAVAVGNDGVYVATTGGIAQVRGREVVAAIDAPPVAEVLGLATGADGTLWACGAEGLARLVAGDWESLGDPFQCTGLFPTPEGQIWIGTSRGARYLDGDVVREHRDGRGIPAGWVRSILPTAQGKAFALLQNTLETMVGYFDGSRWYGYTVENFEHKAIGLARFGGSVVLITPKYLFQIDDAASVSGIGLRPLTVGDRQQVLGYRVSADAPRGTEQAQVEQQQQTQRSPTRLAAIPPNHEDVEAPGFVIGPLGSGGPDVYLVRSSGGKTFVADRNRGVAELDASGNQVRQLRSRDLVAKRDLQLAADERGNPWLITDEGQVATMGSSGELQRVPTPDGVRVWSVAGNGAGVYFASTVNDQPNVVRIYRVQDDAWQVVVERTLVFPEGQGPLVSTPILGVTAEAECWVGLRLRADTESGSRMRGVAVISAATEAIVFHHSVSEPETDGEGSLRMPDDFSNIDLSDATMAWFSTLSGAVRLGNHQAVAFGEDRGVRGEVVSDVLVGPEGRVWMAAAEGPGYRQGQTTEFRMPEPIKRARPLALALDPEGHVWGAGNNGLIRFTGERWDTYSDGLPVTQFTDIEADPASRLWLLAEDRVLLLSRPVAATPAE